MTRKLRTILLGLLIAAGSPSVSWAVNTVFSGYFNGNEPRATHLDDVCDKYADGPLATGFYVMQNLQVLQSGSYFIASPIDVFPHTFSIAIYNQSFDPQHPQANRLDRVSLGWNAIEGEPMAMRVSLVAGQRYQVLVSTTCFGTTGRWVVTFSGPGKVYGGGQDRVTSLPEFTQGTLSQVAIGEYAGCGFGSYLDFGPQPLTRSRYYFVDVLQYVATDICVEIHSGPLDPLHPERTLLRRLDSYSEVFELDPGNYHIVVQQQSQTSAGEDEYFFLLVAEAGSEVVFQRDLAGAWYDPDVPGQGFFFDILEHTGEMFVGWLTFDVQYPLIATDNGLGDSGHRWLTAHGTYERSSAALAVELTRGGLFDSREPAPEQLPIGSMSIDLLDCVRARVRFSLPEGGLEGEMTVRRVGDASSSLCATAQSGPDRPGPIY